MDVQMSSLVDKCRADLPKWEARAADDEAQLRNYECFVNEIRERLAVSRRMANDLRQLLAKYDALQSGRAAPNPS